jgi:hypothetical protein
MKGIVVSCNDSVLSISTSSGLKGEGQNYMEITSDQPKNHHDNICGAKTRSGGMCSNPPEPGKKRCRLHGGAKGSGAPPENKNALKHGLYNASRIEERRTLRAYLKEMQNMVREYSDL